MTRFAIFLGLAGGLIVSLYLYVAPPQPTPEAAAGAHTVSVARTQSESPTTDVPADDSTLEADARAALLDAGTEPELADRTAADYARVIHSSQGLMGALNAWLGDATERIEGASVRDSSRAIAETVGTALRLAGRVSLQAQSMEAQLDGLVELNEERDALREAYTWMEEDEDVRFRLKAGVGLGLDSRLGDPVTALFRDVADLAQGIDAVKAQLRAQSESDADFETRWEALKDDLAHLTEPEIERQADDLETTAERFGDAVERFAEAHPLRVAMDVLPVVFGHVDLQIDVR